MACEVLLPNAAIRNLIREDKMHQIYSQMQMGQGKHGMQTLNQSLLGHVAASSISAEVAIQCTYDPEELTQMIQQWRADRAAGKQSQALQATKQRQIR
jgi:twitching motility protein PilT